MSSIQQNTGVTFERKSGVTLHRKIGVSLERKTGVTFSGISSLISNGMPEWEHELNRIALDINVNPQEFNSYTEQIDAMVVRLEAEFEIYITTPCLTKGKLNEVIDKVLGVHFDQDIQSNAKPKRYKITLMQLEKLIPTIITNKKAKTKIQNADK